MGLFEDMKVFNKVCEFENFSKAAKYLNMSSSSVSKAVKRFEDTTGVTLLNRDTHNIALTNIGRTIFDRTRSIMSDVDQLNAMIERKEIGNTYKVSFCRESRLLFGNEFHHVIKQNNIKYNRKNLVVSDTFEDLESFNFVSSRSDFFVFLGVPKESNLIVRKLTNTKICFYIPEEESNRTDFDIVAHKDFYNIRDRKLSIKLKDPYYMGPLFVFDNYQDCLTSALEERTPVLLPDIYEKEVIDAGFVKMEDIYRDDRQNQGLYLAYLPSRYKDQETKELLDSLFAEFKSKIERVSQ